MTTSTDAAVAAIQFALEADDGMEFLRAWMQGDFPEIRRDWPDVPEAVFVGADPLHPGTQIQLTQHSVGDSPRKNVASLAAKVIQAAMASGLTWDESVAALGVSAKVLAEGAAKDGDGSMDDCQAHAQKRFAEGFAQHVEVAFACSDLSQLKKAYDADPATAEAILANTNFTVVLKH